MKDQVYINLSEEYEIKDWLRRNGLRQTDKNIDVFKKAHAKIQKLLDKETSQPLTWQEF